jgi:hypothetical protein
MILSLLASFDAIVRLIIIVIRNVVFLSVIEFFTWILVILIQALTYFASFAHPPSLQRTLAYIRLFF